MLQFFKSTTLFVVFVLIFNVFNSCGAQEKVLPVATHDGTYYAVNFAPSQTPGELIYAAHWRLWIPAGVETLRGVVVHQHGCGDGSAKPGNAAVEDLHWQALARKYDCALIAVSYEQTGACEMWCDPRNGSAKSFLNALEYFAQECGHSELTVVPWALWGHSGGGQWCSCMVQLFPERILCAWLRSGHPNTVTNIFSELPLNEKVCEVPVILNLGVREKTEFKKIWDYGFPYVNDMRRAGAKIAIFLDPHTGHCCGDSRYPAIQFLDTCMEQRLPEKAGSAEIRPMQTGVVLKADEIGAEIVETTQEESLKPFFEFGYWFPTQQFVECWRACQKDSTFLDTTEPPAPTDVKVVRKSKNEFEITWNSFADPESGLAYFIVERNGVEIAQVKGNQNSVGRPLFQGLMYSDTPILPTPGMIFVDQVKAEEEVPLPVYTIRAVNTCGLKSLCE